MNKNLSGAWSIYDKYKTYYLETGQEYTYEMMCKEYPAVKAEIMAVRGAGSTILEVKPILYLRSIYSVSTEFSNEDALIIINSQMEKERTESTTLERIAAALEFLELMSM